MHLGNIKNKYILVNQEIMSVKMIRHMFVVIKSLLRPPGMLLKYTKCLLLHLLTISVLCVVYDTSLPQTSWQIFFHFFFWISSNTSICILNMSKKLLPSQLLSLCLADKQGMSVYVIQTKYITLQIPPNTTPVLRGTVAPKGVTESQKQSASILKSSVQDR